MPDFPLQSAHVRISRIGSRRRFRRAHGARVAQTVSAAGRTADDRARAKHAVRAPCLTRAHLDKLIAEVRDDAVGGILAVPVADTLKRDAGNGRILRTESREQLWQAQTPQMFRAGLLAQALQQPGSYTDEASAVEAVGLPPRLVVSR